MSQRTDGAWQARGMLCTVTGSSAGVVPVKEASVQMWPLGLNQKVGLKKLGHRNTSKAAEETSPILPWLCSLGSKHHAAATVLGLVSHRPCYSAFPSGFPENDVRRVNI